MIINNSSKAAEKQSYFCSEDMKEHIAIVMEPLKTNQKVSSIFLLKVQMNSLW